MTEPSHAVFLSYASQDAKAAQKICEALRAGGIEAFLDQSELRGGDAWDQKIRHEIHDCALFIPIVSQHTQERLEGYFRHEWKLAIERTHHMAEQMPFLVPVVVDGTRDREAFVPDAFRVVHWTHLPGGETPPAFVERIKRLLSPKLSPMSAVSGATPGMTEPVRATWRSKPVLLAIVAVVIFAALAYLFADKFWISKHLTPAPAAFAPPPHSIAVLPFVNLSGDKEQEYFSDGLSEELLNSLARINELQVAARTSSFYFKGEHADLQTIAHRLNVASVLEGSVRRAGRTIRITAQLNNAVTGFHLWSQTYDRDLSDMLALQTEIANAVAGALKVTLLGDVAAKVELGGTHNPAAFDAYLRASKTYFSSQTEKDYQTAIAVYTEAIRLDPNYALAYADRSIALRVFAYSFAKGPAIRDNYDRAQADAQKAIALAPELAAGHLALAVLFEGDLKFADAEHEYQRALTLEPGNARVLRNYGAFAVNMGHIEAGLAAVRRSVVLDPMNSTNHFSLGKALGFTDHFQDAVAALTHAKALSPDDVAIDSWLGFMYYQTGNLEAARATCEEIKIADDLGKLLCLVVTYEKLGRHTDAEAAFAQLRLSGGPQPAVIYACIYAQRGDTARALDWLETAMRQRDPGLEQLKIAGWLNPLRKEPRFQAIERELKFPSN